jgi:hypothetical protein
MRRLNHRFDKSTRQLAIALCNRLPDLDYEPIKPSLKAMEVFLERMEPFISRFNELVSPDTQLKGKGSADLLKPAISDSKDLEILLSPEQLDIVTEFLPSLGLLDKQKVNSIANITRDIALMIENGEPLNINQAHALMGIAKALQPKVRFIATKFEEYEKLLSKIDEL